MNISTRSSGFFVELLICRLSIFSDMKLNFIPDLKSMPEKETCCTVIFDGEINTNMHQTYGQSKGICKQECHSCGWVASLAEGDILWPLTN